LEEAAQAIETALRRLPGESELLELLADVRAEITRREEIRLALAQAQQLLGEDKLEQAEAVLSECDRRHPESADVRGLLGFTRESLAARKRAEEIARTAAHATELLNQNRPHEATTLLKLALEQYPGEERLEVLLARANREVAEVGRQRAVENLLREAETLVEKGRYAEAIAMLDGGIHAYRDDRLGQAKAFAQERARAAEIGRILEEANSQRSRKGLDAAVQCLERGLDRFPGEPEITALLEKVRSEKAEHERKEVVTAAVRRADAAIAKERPEEALEAIDAALRLYAGDRELLEYRAHVEGEAHRLQRERARREQLARLADLAKAARTASSSQELESVAGAAWDLLTPYQHDSEFQETAARVRAEIERRAVRLARPPRAPINKRYLAYGAAAGAVIVIVVAVGLYVKRRPAAPQPEVPPRPALRSAQILEFYASRPVISEGQGVEVCYGVENANEVRLDPPVATLTPASHRCVEVRPAASSEFKLIAKGEDGVESVQSLRITVQAVPAAIGTLVVRTQVDGATVLIDGHPYGRTTESGEVRIPLAPKEYTVGVEKKAYDSPAPRRIRVVADGVHREPFVLQPKPATLTISGAPAGTQVWLDGKPLGSVSGSGTFSVVHGTHTIELVRDRPIYARRTMAFEPGSVVSINRQDLVIPETPAPKPAPPPQEPPLDPRAIAAREWARIQDSRDPAVFEQFLRLPASGPYATAARQKIEQLEWEGVRGRRDIGALQAFIDKYPSGPHRDDAARLMEQLEWGRVNRNDLEALLAFQRKYPNSQQAAAAIERLRVTQRQAGEAQAIVDALNRFARAYETKNVAELTRVWPGIPRGTLRTIRTVFSQARSISMQLRPVGPAQLSNDTAIVRCERSSVTVYDQPRQVTEIITVRLRRGADGWVIEGID
jgi:outer membrane protein assembly factor BamD (BamD/ComL family)